MQEQILLKLGSIEKRLIEQNLLQKEIFTFAEACLYLDLSSSHLYKLTSSNTIPCYCPQGKKLYFRRPELDLWLTRTRSASVAEVEQKAADYISTKSRANEGRVRTRSEICQVQPTLGEAKGRRAKR